MACNRRGIRRTPSPRSRRRKKHGAQPASPRTQPNLAQGYFRASWRVPIQPIAPAPYELAIEESLLSFPSHQSNRPSAAFQDRASSLTSGTTSRLESERGLSIHTPTTPTSLGDGDLREHFGNTVQVGQNSPSSADFTLRGIDNNSHYPRDYGFESAYDEVALTDGLYERPPAFEGDKWDSSGWISVTKLPGISLFWEPWNGHTLHHDGQSSASDFVEEGLVFQKEYVLASSNLELPHEIHQLINSTSGNRPSAQNSFLTQDSQQQSSTSSIWAYRENEAGEDRTPASTSSASTASPIPATQDKIPKCGIRTGPLTDDGRENARKMRKQGCCSRCFFMKERCVMQADGICKRCRELWNKHRTWDLPCSDTGLDQRSKYMSPDALVFKLKGHQVATFLKNEFLRCVPGSKSFKFSLTLGSGIPLRFDAIEFIPRDGKSTPMITFGLAADGSTMTMELDSPPILPFVVDRNLIARDANLWIDCIIRQTNSDFLEDYFSEPDEQWEKEMLTIICRYHQAHIPDLEAFGHGPYQTLRRALKMAVLNHIMSRPLVVPEHEVEALSYQLRSYKIANTAKWICPRLTNRIIKSMLLPMFQHTTVGVLQDLSSSKMLRARGGEDLIWDQVFCIVFLCLVVVGKTQASLAEYAKYAELGMQNKDESFSFQHAKSEIIEMEAELSTHLIGMFHHRFGTTKKGNGKGRTFNPLARNPCDRPDFHSPLAQMVRNATDKFGSGLVDPIDLQKADIKRMKKENVIRLLGRFMQPFFER